MNKPLTKRNCRECGEEFTPYDETDMLCEDCEPFKVAKHCRVCGKQFEGYPYEDICQECDDDWNENYIEVECAECGKKITIPKSQQDNPYQWCSECYAEKI